MLKKGSIPVTVFVILVFLVFTFAVASFGYKKYKASENSSEVAEAVEYYKGYAEAKKIIGEEAESYAKKNKEGWIYKSEYMSVAVRYK